MTNADGLLTDKQEELEEITFADARKQILASCITFTLVIQVGTSMSYSSVLLPQLKGDIEVDTSQESWIGKYLFIN